MSGEIQTLIDQRVNLINDARTFLDECEADHGGLTEEENARWETLHAEAEELKGQIDKLEAEQQAKADPRGARVDWKYGCCCGTIPPVGDRRRFQQSRSRRKCTESNSKQQAVTAGNKPSDKSWIRAGKG